MTMQRCTFVQLNVFVLCGSLSLHLPLPFSSAPYVVATKIPSVHPWPTRAVLSLPVFVLVTFPHSSVAVISVR